MLPDFLWTKYTKRTAVVVVVDDQFLYASRVSFHKAVTAYCFYFIIFLLSKKTFPNSIVFEGLKGTFQASYFLGQIVHTKSEKKKANPNIALPGLGFGINY